MADSRMYRSGAVSAGSNDLAVVHRLQEQSISRYGRHHRQGDLCASIGDKVDAIIFDPETKMIFTSNGEGMISVIRQKSADQYESVGSIKTQITAKTMAFDPKTKRLFLSAVDTQTLGTGPNAKVTPIPGTLKVLVVERQQEASGK